MSIGDIKIFFQIIGSLVDFEGELSFINNTAFEEGALSLLSYGQIRVHRGLSLNFIGNNGRCVIKIVTVDLTVLCACMSICVRAWCSELGRA